MSFEKPTVSANERQHNTPMASPEGTFEVSHPADNEADKNLHAHGVEETGQPGEIDEDPYLDEEPLEEYMESYEKEKKLLDWLQSPEDDREYEEQLCSDGESKAVVRVFGPMLVGAGYLTPERFARKLHSISIEDHPSAPASPAAN